MSAFHIYMLYTFFVYAACLLAFMCYDLMLLWIFVFKCIGEQILGPNEQDLVQIRHEKSTTGLYQEKHSLNTPVSKPCRPQDLDNSL